MKIIFFGSGAFAVPILEAIVKKSHSLLLVVTQPDRSKGRHLHLSQTPIKTWAQSNGLKIFQPMDINALSSLELLKKENADVYMVASYGQILSADILALPKICVNAHASLLPKYRGAAPVAYALINGERATGVTFIKMNEKMDQGDIIFKKSISIQKSDNAQKLQGRLSYLAASTAGHVLSKIEKNKFKLLKQNEKEATYAPMIKKKDGFIHWETTSKEIYNRFLGCFGWPGSLTYYKGKLLKIFSLGLGRRKSKGCFGEIIFADGDTLEVACKKGTIVIREVLLESHKRMDVKSFLAGHEVKVGDFLGMEKPLQDE